MCCTTQVKLDLKSGKNKKLVIYNYQVQSISVIEVIGKINMWTLFTYILFPISIIYKQLWENDFSCILV